MKNAELKYIQFKNDNITEIIEFINQLDVAYSTATFIDNKGITEGMQINLKAKHKNKINSIYLRNNDYLVLQDDGLRKYNKSEFELIEEENIITERKQIYNFFEKELEDMIAISNNIYGILNNNMASYQDGIYAKNFEITIKRGNITFFIDIIDKNTSISNHIEVGSSITKLKDFWLHKDYVEYDFPVSANVLKKYINKNLKLLKRLKTYIEQHIQYMNSAKYENLTKQVIKIK